MTNPIIDFSSAIAAAGLGNPDVIPDGAVHRFHCDGDRSGTLNGWYCLYTDGTPAGVFGSWKTGITETWCAIERDQQTPEQRAHLRELIEQAREQRDQEQRQRNAKAAVKARGMMERSKPADPNHPYLTNKQVQPHGIRQIGADLLVPIYIDGGLTSVQTISRGGSKRFLTGGRITGGSYLIDDQTHRDELLICEGFATGASLVEHIGAAVFVAFNANNLLAVARYVRQQHPEAKIIVCADDDRWTEGNPGKTKARAAALDIGGKLLIPDFNGFDLSSRPSDWNDLYQLRRQNREVSA